MISEGIPVVRCADCHAASRAPRSHCPRCGSRTVSPGTVPSSGTVLAATELSVPPPGFEAPHRLILLELEEGVRILATSKGPVPDAGVRVRLGRIGDLFEVIP